MNWELIIDGQIIIYSEYKYQNKQYNIEMFLKSEDFKNFLTTLKQKYIIVLWWDGTMLSSIHKYYNKNIPFLWINFWNKWFLLHDKNIILCENNFFIEKYSLFDIFIDGKKQATFINEINVTSLNGKMWEFELKLWDKDNLQFKWDWFIIATPLWSTAYNNSLWWPILSHSSKSIVFTPKAAWQPKHLPSIILDENESIFIKNIWRYHWLEIFSDSIKIDSNCDSVEIRVKKSDYILEIAIAEKYKSTWENKIFQF